MEASREWVGAQVNQKKVEVFRFYGHHPGKPGWQFSNFSNHPIEIDGIVYSTTEHYFQAEKFRPTYGKGDEKWAQDIAKSETPHEAKKMGGSRKHIIRSDWESVKDKVMLKALRAKARQHKDFRKALFETDDAHLIEASPWDYYWGEGSKKTGKNMLGKLLMVVRSDVRMWGNNIPKECDVCEGNGCGSCPDCVEVPEGYRWPVKKFLKSSEL